jgi:hypothetical protein
MCLLKRLGLLPANCRVQGVNVARDGHDSFVGCIFRRSIASVPVEEAQSQKILEKRTTRGGARGGGTAAFVPHTSFDTTIPAADLQPLARHQPQHASSPDQHDCDVCLSCDQQTDTPSTTLHSLTIFTIPRIKRTHPAARRSAPLRESPPWTT